MKTNEKSHAFGGVIITLNAFKRLSDELLKTRKGEKREKLLYEAQDKINSLRYWIERYREAN